MRKTLSQAMADALAIYLQGRFDALEATNPSIGHVYVLPEWPPHDKPLAMRPNDGGPFSTLSITLMGEPEDTRQPEILVKTTPTADPNTLLLTFAAKVRSQRMQIDVWETTPPERGEKLSYLDDFLHAGEQITLGVGTGGLVRDGVLLRLPTGEDYPYEGMVDFTFEAASVDNDPNLLRQFDARGMIRAIAEAELTVQATSARLARVQLQGLLGADTYSATATRQGGFRMTPQL